jgi:hypothetical protein
MGRPSTFSPRRRFRIVMGAFIAGLVLSGVTAFPLLWEARLAADMLGVGDAASPAGHAGLAGWILTIRFGLEDAYAAYPWIAYGTDWLGFAHLAIALFFIGPMIDPRSSRGNILAGMAASVGVVPLALICGEVRGIPFGWRLVDSSFGVIGFALLFYCLRLLPRIEEEQAGAG